MKAGESHKRFNPMPEVVPAAADTALIVIDMQYRSAHRDYGWAKKARDAGNEHLFTSLFARLPMVIGNIQRIQSACRSAGIEVIFVINRAWTRDGRDLSPSYRIKGARCAPGTKEVEILEEIKPIGDEIVMNKLSTNPFSSSPIDSVLRYMGIRKVLVAGVNTNYCVESFVRTAYDLGYEVVLLEDCCATVNERFHEVSCDEMDGIFCKVMSTSDVITAVQAVAKLEGASAD